MFPHTVIHHIHEYDEDIPRICMPSCGFHDRRWVGEIWGIWCAWGWSVGSILLHSLVTATAACPPPPANNHNKGVGSATMITLAIGVLLPIAVNCRCLPPPPQESTPPLATITFNWLLSHCCCHCCLLSTTALPLVPTFLLPPRSTWQQNPPITTNAAFPSQLYPCLPLPLPSIVDCWSVVVCLPLSTPLPSALSHCLPPAPSSSIITPLPLMVGFFLCPSPTLFLSAHVVVGCILPHDPRHPPQTPPCLRCDHTKRGRHNWRRQQWQQQASCRRRGQAVQWSTGTRIHSPPVRLGQEDTALTLPTLIAHRIFLPPQRLPSLPLSLLLSPVLTSPWLRSWTTSLFQLGGLHTFSITSIHAHFNSMCYIGIKPDIQKKG